MMILSIVRTKQSRPKTLMLMEIVKNKELTILVYFGNMHNCVDINVAKELNLFVYPTRDLTIKVVYGHHVNDKGRCHKKKSNTRLRNQIKILCATT